MGRVAWHSCFSAIWRVLKAMRSSAILISLAFATSACAQVTSFEFGAGYARSDSFSRDSGGTGRLEGIELSVSKSFLKVPLLGDVRLGVSWLNGGDDGNMYRIFARYRTPSSGPNSVYGVTGLHYGHAKGKSGSFGKEAGFGSVLGLGFPLGSVIPGTPGLTLEALYLMGPEPQLRGWSVSALVRF
jgi:hypothetical protein